MNIPLKKRYAISLACVTLICALVFIGGLNRPHLSPFSNKLETKYVFSAVYSDRGSALVDNQGKRMLMLSPDFELTAVADATKSGSPVDKFTMVTMYGGSIYALGYTQYSMGVYLSSESVLEYDLSGKYVRTLYTESYPQEARVNVERFANLIISENSVYLTKINENSVSVADVLNDRAIGQWTLDECVYTAGYSPVLNACIATGLSQSCYRIDCESGAVKPVGFIECITEQLRASGIDFDMSYLDALSNYRLMPSVVINADGKAMYFTLVDFDNNSSITISNDRGSEYSLDSVSLSARLFAKTLGYWLAVAALGAEIIALVIWLLVKKLRAKGRTAFLVLACIFITSIFYTAQIRDATEESYAASLVAQTKQISYVITKACGDSFNEIRDIGIYEYCTDARNQKEINELHNALKTLCDANGVDQSCGASFALYGDNGELYAFADSENEYMTGEIISLSDEVLDRLTENDYGVITVESYIETFVYDYEYIRDTAGEIVGVLCVSGYRGNLLELQSQMTVDLIVSLIALFIGIYMAFTVIKIFSSDIKRRWLKPRSDVIGRSLDMAGIYSFAQGIIFGLDSVIVVYVAKSLCANADSAYQTGMVALTLAMVTAGALIGSLLTPILSIKIGERATALIVAVMSIISMLVCMFAVYTGSIYLYIAGKFSLGMFVNGALYVITDGIPHRTSDAETMKGTMARIGKCGAAAAIVSALIGGYIAQYLSYDMVYLLGAFLCVILLVITLFAFVGRKYEKQVDGENSTARGTWRIFLKTPALMYVILYMLPNMLVDGYKAFLFPMYTSNAGISALLLSNLSVFVKSLTFVSLDGIRKLARRFSAGFVMNAPMLFISASLVCFIISPNIYWAIAMMFIYEIMTRTARITSVLYLVKISEKYNIDAKTVRANSLTIESLMNIFQSPALSMMVGLGMNLACTVVGAITGAMFTVFAVYNKFSGKKPKENE